MKILNKEEWLEKAKEVHGDKYDYSKVKYDRTKKVEIICPIHGTFYKVPRIHTHLKQGCPACSGKKKLTTEEFISRSKSVHGNKYDYSKVKYKNNSTKVKIVCPKHGEFIQTPISHYQGHGCPKCAPNYSGSKHTYIQECNKIHKNRYDYSKANFNKVHDLIKIKCPIHGYFRLRAYAHKQGQGCPMCGIEKTSAKNRMTEKQFQKLLSSEFKFKPIDDFSQKTNPKVYIYCKKHGKQQTTAKSALYKSSPCPKCRKSINSKPQRKLTSFVKSITKSKVITNFRLSDKKHLDIYLPKYKIGIEVNGLYWHSEDKLPKDYHYLKTKQCKKQGISLLHFWDYEIAENFDLVCSMIKSKLGKCNSIYARKTSSRKISSAVANNFLKENHLQGSCNAKIHYGLFKNEKLVAVMNFGKPRFSSSYDWELIRYANKKGIYVVGGASKLLKTFEKENNPSSLVSYANRRFSEGNLYKKLKFEYIGKSKPNYFYFKNSIRLSRYKTQKSKLSKILEEFDTKLSEHENMVENGFTRIFDCGNLIFRKLYNENT